jgi:Flp pilus assembly protein TadD
MKTLLRILLFSLAAIVLPAGIAGAGEVEDLFKKCQEAQLKGDADTMISCMDAVLKIDPKNSTAHNNRGTAYGMKGDLEKEIKDFSDAIELKPDDPVAWCNRGLAFGRKGDLDRAVVDFDKAIQLDTNAPGPHVLRGEAHAFKGDYAKALADYDTAIALDPKNPGAFKSRGLLFESRGEFEKAVSDYQQGLRLDPKDPIFYNQLAWVRATCPTASTRNGKEAAEMANKACELSEWKNWTYIDSLAAAEAESGDFENAVKHQKQALDMAGPADPERAEASQRLALYEKKQPYHQPAKH